MYAIEFQAPIQGGVVKIPEHYLPKLKGNVRFIILTEDEPTTLMESPLPITSSQLHSRKEITPRQAGILNGKLSKAFFEPLPEEELKAWEI